TLSFSSTASGTFTLSFNGLTTAPITYGSGGAALAADIQAKLGALLSTSAATATRNVAVSNPSSSDPNIIKIVFQNALGHRNVNQLTASALSTAGTVTVGTIVDGQLTETVANVTLGTGTSGGKIVSGTN